jgi:hypothetical protein
MLFNKILKVLIKRPKGKQIIRVRDMKEFSYNFPQLYTLLPSWNSLETSLKEMEKYRPKRRKVIKYLIQKLFQKGELSQKELKKELKKKKILSWDRALKAIAIFQKEMEKFRLLPNKNISLVIRACDLKNNFREMFPPYTFRKEGKKGRPKRIGIEELSEEEIEIKPIEPEWQLFQKVEETTESGKEIYYKLEPVFFNWYKIKKLIETKRKIEQKIQELKKREEELKAELIALQKGYV